MTTVTAPSKYELPYNAGSRATVRRVAQHMQAPARAQAWDFEEVGQLGGQRYRVLVHYDHSYEAQAWATISMWGAGGWNELIRVYGSELHARKMFGRNRFTGGGEPADFHALAQDLLTEAAQLLFL